MVFGITTLFLGVGIQPAIAQQDKEIDIKYKELDSNQGQISQNGFCILLVYTHRRLEWLTPIPAPFVLIKCEDLDTCRIRLRITNLFGTQFFIGLQKDNTYKITAIAFGEKEVIKLTKPLNYVKLDLGYIFG